MFSVHVKKFFLNKFKNLICFQTHNHKFCHNMQVIQQRQMSLSIFQSTYLKNYSKLTSIITFVANQWRKLRSHLPHLFLKHFSWIRNYMFNGVGCYQLYMYLTIKWISYILIFLERQFIRNYLHRFQ